MKVLVALALLVCAVSAQLTQVGVGGFGSFYDLTTAPCSMPCNNNAHSCSLPSIAVPTTSMTDATVTIDLTGDWGFDDEDIDITCEGYNLTPYCDSVGAGWSNDCGTTSDCADYASATQTIPQAAWATIIADGFVDCTADIGARVNCFCSGGIVDAVLLDFSFTAGSGGGGDPHIFTPNLPTHMDLFEFVQVITGRTGEDHMEVNLISSPAVSVIGHISNQPSTARHYFTAFTVGTATETVLIGFESLNGFAQASLSSDSGEQLTCASASSRHVMENEHFSVSMDCSDSVQERAASNPVLAFQFPNHVQFSRTAFMISTEDFELELFFVQKDLTDLGFGFFDFSVAPLPLAQELGGLFTNSPPKPEADRAAGSHGRDKTAFILANVAFAY